MGAAMIKWGVLEKAVDEHSQRLSDFLNSIGIVNQLRAVTIEEVGIQAANGDAADSNELDVNGIAPPARMPADLQWIRVPSHLGSGILHRLARITQECRELQYCDGILIKGSEVWPKVALPIALTRTFSEFKFVDTTKAILIVGSGGRARASASAAVTLGFKNVVFVSADVAQMQDSVELLRRTHFATTFNITLSEKLVEIASAYSVCIFANDEVLDESFRTELSFFNFLTPEGVVLDVSCEIEQTSLQEAAREANVTVVHADVPLSYLDSTWVEWVFDHKLDLTKFREFSSGTACTSSPDFQSEG
jgi:hypothetical protein